MSHFLALCIGDVEDNMAPFHQYECTGTNDAAIVSLDITQEARDTYKESLDEQDSDTAYSFSEHIEGYYDYDILGPNDTPDVKEEHKWGYAQKDAQGNIRVFKRTNADKFRYQDESGADIAFSAHGHPLPFFGGEARTLFVSDVPALREFLIALNVQETPVWAFPNVFQINPLFCLKVTQALAPLLATKDWALFAQELGFEGDPTSNGYLHRFAEFCAREGYFFAGNNPDPTGVVRSVLAGGHKWDWYQEGGRFGAPFILKNGGRAYKARKRELDFVAMRAEDRNRQRKDYEDIGYHPSMTWRSWEDIMKDETIPDFAQKREAYHAQPTLVQLRENAQARHGNKFFFFDFDALLGMGKEDYVDAQSSDGLTCYAFVDQHGWFSKGHVGWFGVTKDEVEHKAWLRALKRRIEKMDDDEMLTAVDCHI